MKNTLRNLFCIGIISFVGFKAYQESRVEHQIREPFAVEDINGDKIEDIVVIKPNLSLKDFEQVEYYSGKSLKRDEVGNLSRDKEGYYVTKGVSFPISGIKIKKSPTHYSRRTISLGNFDNKSGIDLVVLDSDPNSDEVIEQRFNNVFPEIKR